LRRLLLLLFLALLVAAAWFVWKNASSQLLPRVDNAPRVTKQPMNVVTRTFDRENPPSDMPPLAPGEAAVCDSNFRSVADVGGDAHRTDDSHGIVTVNSVNVNLQLDITIWLPINASDRLIEHEQGHREISEHFYENADKLAAQIASTYLGRKFSVSGSDVNAELNKSLRQMAAEITQQYNQQLDPNPTQLRYDAITNHSLNDIPSKDAVAQALAEMGRASTRPATRSTEITAERFAQVRTMH
jgi:hypothetical protein